MTLGYGAALILQCCFNYLQCRQIFFTLLRLEKIVVSPIYRNYQNFFFFFLGVNFPLKLINK